MPLSKAELEERSFKLGLFFKPTSPINKESLFAGRIPQVREVVDTIVTVHGFRIDGAFF